MPEDTTLSTVRDLKALADSPGHPFTSVLVVKKLTVKTAANGNPYLTLELGDRTGTFYATLFNDHPSHDTLRESGEGQVLRIEGRIDTYQNRLAPKLIKITPLTDDELAAPGLLDNLVELAPENADALWTELQQHIDAITHDALRLTARSVFEEIGPAFRWTPAAISMHHAYRHGLVEHTIHMARACRALLPLYPEVDADLALTGILLHDTGKVIEYEGALATKRSRKGILQGHVVLGYQLTRKAGMKNKLDPDRLERLEHIILSHQGEPEWGAAVYAATPEAVFVSMIDNLDAKMGMVQRALRQANETEDFSERLSGLNTTLLTRPLPPS